MPIDRNAAVNYARTFWNRVADDDKFWTSNAEVSLPLKRKLMDAPVSEGWIAFFVANDTGGEDAVFRRTINGRVEQKPDPIARFDDLDDCTHYVSRCLHKEGIVFKQTPRANELALAMLSSASTKTLALKAKQDQGQKVIDSGILKPGDLIAYYTKARKRYTHTAMFVGRQAGGAQDPGGITCHTVCRFEGLTEAWNGFSDDSWFLDQEKGLLYTLIHFSEDDSEISAATLKWLPGWWQAGTNFYCVLENGRAYSTYFKPEDTNQKLMASPSSGHYFEVDEEVVFIWPKPAGAVQVERWTAPTQTKGATLKIDGTDSSLTRIS